LRKYTRRFFEIRATIPNISEGDIIDCFHNGISDQTLFKDIGRNCPKTVAGLRDMLQQWADQEEQEHDRFLRRNGDYNNNCGKQGNDHCNNKSQ
jgi:hypothetical protein